MEHFVIIVNGCHKELHLGCRSSPRSASDCANYNLCNKQWRNTFFTGLGFLQGWTATTEFVLKYVLEVNIVAVRTKNPSMINQMLLIFIYGVCYLLITPKCWNIIFRINLTDVWVYHEKKLFEKNFENFSENSHFSMIILLYRFSSSCRLNLQVK